MFYSSMLMQLLGISFIPLIILLYAFYKRKSINWSYIWASIALYYSTQTNFRAGGTLDNISGDSPLVAMLRVYSSNGTSMATLGIAVLILTYGGIIYLCRKAVK